MTTTSKNSTEAPGRRRLLHTRRVECEAWVREDGLIDLEGTMVDVKPEETFSGYRTVAANTPFHQMRLVLTVDAEYVIREAKAETHAAPTPTCPDIAPAYAALVGLRIGPGFKKLAAERVGGLKGCTHLTELLGPMATTLVQSTFREQITKIQQQPGSVEKPWIIGSCHIYHPDSEVSKRIWPLEQRGG